MSLKFSIITPSYNMLNYLKLCHASIADQKGISVEHIVIDGGSTDGTLEWLKQKKNIRWISEKDNGMYDALNKGLKIAKGDILAYLNCDEQYLPGTLNYIKEYFEKNTNVDIDFGDALLVDTEGKLLSFRKGYQPRWVYISLSHLYVLSCTFFFRRKIIEEGNYFNINFRIVGDGEFVIRLLRRGYKAVHLKKFLSVFTITGKNMSVGENARKEEYILCRMNPLPIQLLKYPINIIRLFEKFISGAYFQKFPLVYSIITQNSYPDRTNIISNKATYRWPNNINKE